MATYAITYTPAGLLVNDRTFPEPVLTIKPKTIINEPVLEIQSSEQRMGIVITDTVTVAGSPGATTLAGLKTQILAIIPTLAGLKELIGQGGGAGVTSYTALSDKPTIPTNNNQLTNGAGFVNAAGVISILDANPIYFDEAYLNGNGSQGNPYQPKAGRGFTPKGAWTPSTTLTADDVVTYGGKTYRVTTTHLSGGSFTTTNLELWADKGQDGAALGPDYTLYPAMLLETEPLALGTANVTPTSGSAYTRKITAVKSGSATSVAFRVTTAGATLTAGAVNNSIAIYDATGTTRLGIADCNTAFTTTGDKLMSFDTPVSLVAGTIYILSLVATGTTTPVLVGSAGSNLFNLNQSAPPYNFARVTTGGNGTTIPLTGGSVVDARGSGRFFIALF